MNWLLFNTLELDLDGEEIKSGMLVKRYLVLPGNIILNVFWESDSENGDQWDWCLDHPMDDGIGEVEDLITRVTNFYMSAPNPKTMLGEFEKWDEVVASAILNTMDEFHKFRERIDEMGGI